MGKRLAGIVALAMCLSLLFSSAPFETASASGGDGTVTYRALLIGNATYDGGSLRAPGYDAMHMRQLLLQQDLGGGAFGPSDIFLLNDATELQIMAAIENDLAARADGDDVTYFYYSGHGSFDGSSSYIVGAEMSLIGVDELKQALDRVQGRKVVFIDSCYAGGVAGRSAGPAEPASGTKLKDDADTMAKAEALSPDEQRALFQEGLMRPFMKQQARVARSLASAGYEVLMAASSFQYSFEFAFNSTQPGAVSYGPQFVMNGADYAGGAGNWSGEFTGMLVAGAGRVSFNSTFPEIRALADADRDRRITLDELYRYLRGAVVYSTVQVYPEGDQTVLFEHSEASAPDWGGPVLAVGGNEGPHAPDADDPVEFALLCSAQWSEELTVRRAYLAGDNRYADNDAVDVAAVATVASSAPHPAGETVALAWDGAKADGSEAGDGWYFAELKTGSLKYPPVPFELARGISNYPADAETLPENTEFTASLPGPASERWYTFAPEVDGLMDLRSTNGTAMRNPKAELYDGDGNLLFESDDVSAEDYNFRLLRVLRAGRRYAVRVRFSAGSGADVSLSSRFLTPAANGIPVSVDASSESYTLFRPDVSGAWSFEALSAMDDDSPGIVLYDAYFNPVAYGDRWAQSYRYLAAHLGAGSLYILSTPVSAAPMRVAAYAPGAQPALDYSSMTQISASGSDVRIAHAWDTEYFRFTPKTSGIYRFRSTSPEEGASPVDSYAFLLDAKGYALASDDDVNCELRQLQFDFTARLSAGVTYVLAVRAYVRPGQLSETNKYLDFKVYVEPAGGSEKARAVAQVAAGGGSAVALLDDDGNPENGIGAGGLPEGWGEGVESGGTVATGLDFGEGPCLIRRYAPQLLYVPGGAAFTKLWRVGEAYVARDSGRGLYAWGVGTDDADFGYIRRLDDAANGLMRYDVACIAQGAAQSAVYFLDGASGKIYRMAWLGAAPAEEPAPYAFYTKIAVSDGCLFALDSAGNVYAKGSNRYGECGGGNTSPVAQLTRITALPGNIADIAAGGGHALALGADGRAWAWGRNDFGSVGAGGVERTVGTPTQVSFEGLLEPGEGIEKVFAGGGCSAVLTTAGRVFVWGANGRGQLGVGDTFSRNAPVEAAALAPSAPGSSRHVVSIAYGPESAYAVLSDGSVWVCGANGSGQLGFVSGDVRTFKPLYEPDLRSANSKLKSLKLSAGRLSPAFSPEVYEYDVVMPQGVALSTVKAAKADASAVLTIDGKQAASKTVNAGPSSVRVEIDVTAQNGGVQAYVLHFPRSPSSNAFLSSVAVSAGCLQPALNRGDFDYAVAIPETARGPVKLTFFPADPNSALSIDGRAGGRTLTADPGEGETLVAGVRVTAQMGNTRDYSFAIERKPLLSGFSAEPSYAGLAVFSPGGADGLTFRYALNMPATVRIEVKNGEEWKAILNRNETEAGEKEFIWDGRIGGMRLPTGSYDARVTPFYAGVAGTPKELSFGILPQPRLLLFVTPPTFRAGGVRMQNIRFLWTQPCRVKAEVVAPSGAVVKTLYAAQSASPGGAAVRWDGRSDAGVPLKPGYYYIRITCGAKTYSREIRIVR